jgi:hypothetical protein
MAPDDGELLEPPLGQSGAEHTGPALFAAVPIWLTFGCSVDWLVGMNPAMKSLEGPQRFISEVGVNSMKRIGQHGPERAE